ncbi:MAG: prepilin-type cleavage/methylation domain-containing protein [Proteobacteria bacterium]|nr:prepilin-type cleavage/methylation domain-containing protein [Burkholderiales bacterium]
MSHRARERGVSLVELAIGLLILSLIIGGLLVPLANQVEQSRNGQTQRQLEEIRDALIGFALANGRLPCPAAPNTTGIESFLAGSAATGGTCTNPYDGFVPAVTLGLSQVDAQGYAIDAWGLEQNRVRYAVTNSNSSAFTTRGEMRTRGMSALFPDLYVCSGGTNIAAGECPSGERLVVDAVAVIYSLGPNAASGGTSVDERQNPNPFAAVPVDKAFVSRVRGAVGAGAAEFDDLVTWLSPNVLYSKMVSAGQLP